MRRPTILFMNRVYPPVHGATGRVLRDLAESFAREGWHVTVVTSGENAGEERRNGVRIIRVKGPERPRHVLSYMWVWLKMLLLSLRLKSRHVVVSMSDPPLVVVAGGIVAFAKRSRHINWCHDVYPEVMPALGIHVPKFLMKVFVGLRRRAMARADKVIVNGRCMARYLAEDGLDMAHISMIPNWPDVELTDPEIIDGNVSSFPVLDQKAVRPFDKLIKNDRKFRVLYAGNLGMAHPFETVLDAAEILLKKNCDIEFVFVGDGARYDDLVHERAKRGLDNIRMLPFQPAHRLREVMESGDVHLVTLRDDAAGFIVPSKLYSGLAVGRPCILVGPIESETAKVIRDFEAGYVVAEGDGESLAEAILTMREDGDSWFSAHHGAVQAREVFTPKDAMDAWKDRTWDIVRDELEPGKAA